jgi:secreted trypsin-like serine protease
MDTLFSRWFQLNFCASVIVTLTSSSSYYITTGYLFCVVVDSGGPLESLLGGEYNQVGTVSFGAEAGCELEYPVGFTRVTSYLGWIETNTGVSLQL